MTGTLQSTFWDSVGCEGDAYRQNYKLPNHQIMGR